MTQKSALPVYRDAHSVGTGDEGISSSSPSVRLPSIRLGRTLRPIAENAASAALMAKPASERGASAVIDRIRSKLRDPNLRIKADPADLAAVQAFYLDSSATPLWITDMGLSARGQSALFEIEKADDWGLYATLSSFRLQAIYLQVQTMKRPQKSRSILPY